MPVLVGPCFQGLCSRTGHGNVPEPILQKAQQYDVRRRHVQKVETNNTKESIPVRDNNWRDDTKRTRYIQRQIVQVTWSLGVLTVLIWGLRVLCRGWGVKWG